MFLKSVLHGTSHVGLWEKVFFLENKQKNSWTQFLQNQTFFKQKKSMKMAIYNSVCK